MTGLIAGGLLGLLVAFLVVLLPTIAILDDVSYGHGTLVKIIGSILFVGVIIVGCILGCIGERNKSGKYIEQYLAEKQTIEKSLQNESLSGLERIELVKQAVETNKKLAGYQYDCKKWYGFNIDDRILELSFIDLEVNK